MADKDLSVVISEMLRKQDQQTEILRETNSTLTQFMGVSVKQFEQQHKFNEQQQEFNKQQQEFNAKFLEQNHKIVDQVDSIEEKLVHIVDMSDRIKRLEAAVFK